MSEDHDGPDLDDPRAVGAHTVVAHPLHGGLAARPGEVIRAQGGRRRDGALDVRTADLVDDEGDSLLWRVPPVTYHTPSTAFWLDVRV